MSKPKNIGITKNRRKEERYAYNIDCQVIVFDEMYKSNFSDVSLGGASILIGTRDLKINIGDELRLTFLKEGYHVVEIIGIVRNIVGMGDRGIRYGLEITGGRIDIWKTVLNSIESSKY